MSVAGFKDKCKYKRLERCMEVTINGRTNRFYAFGGKDESSYQLIQGLTIAGALLDEVALMPRSFVEQCLARTLTYENKKIWFNCNPESRMHWFNQEWIIPTDKGEKNGVTHLHFMMHDNPIMTDEAIRQAEGMFSGIFYKRYILGEWVMAEGLIYDMFDQDYHVLKTEPQTEGDYFVSSDFGIQNATTFLLWRRERASNRWICINEYYYSGRENKRQKTVSELVQGLAEMLDGIEPRVVIVDPSAAALIEELHRKGYRTQKADNDVLDGISDVSTMLRNNNLAIVRNCRHTIEEFEMYAWDNKAAERGEDKPIKDFDHCMDAVRYFVKTRKLVRRTRT
jgi:PBSX family phage terminase large subunit